MAIRKLGEVYKSKDYEDIERSYSESAFWYRCGSDIGDTPCMIELAKLYESGDGVVQSYPKAIELYRAAAEKDDDQAVFILASRYEDGVGVDKDLDKALELYKKAAHMGNSYAMRRLADWYLYEDSSEVAKDMALMMYRKSSNEGCIGADMDLGHIYENGVIVTRSVNRALRCYYDAANAGEKEGMSNYSRLLNESDPLEKEEEETPLENSMRIAIDHEDG